ncbi:alpha/beta-hydrolase [Periconia macrospinosa]|uniref:Alpha/beta-hydrolase n=1 Tax=Periconia macrospinosa TaxID=97972 RepID=A0A2V1DRQ2_9PLEO|nr:alpha/beta-hydrolase [Periconia macrospinosa]
MATPRPYRISIPVSKHEQLQQKLFMTRFPSDAADSDGSSWGQGPPVNEIQRLSRFWQTEYTSNWQKVEARLNLLPQYIISIPVEDLAHTYDIHFVHKKSDRKDAIPLLFLHGWPGSFIEVTKIVDDLTTGNGEDGPAFHVVAPSLVDFGFSSRSTKGFRFQHHAEVCHRLMKACGYDRYVVQAGDVGSLVARYMAKQYGSTGFVALHTNTPAPMEPTKEKHPELHDQLQSTPLTETEQQCMQRTANFMSHGRGYYSMMSTKPTTIGYSLSDSPVALLAWIYEKLHDWSDDYPWSDEEILTWVSIYYFSTAGPEASSNAYYAMEHDEPPAFVGAAEYVDVPLGISRFQNDLIVLPKMWNKTLGPIVFEEEHARGGHFAAWERPDAIVKDLRAMFAKGGAWESGKVTW